MPENSDARAVHVILLEYLRGTCSVLCQLRFWLHMHWSVCAPSCCLSAPHCRVVMRAHAIANGSMCSSLHQASYHTITVSINSQTSMIVRSCAQRTIGEQQQLAGFLSFRASIPCMSRHQQLLLL